MKILPNTEGNQVKDSQSSDSENATDDNQPIINEKTKNGHAPKACYHARLPHSVYKNTIEHHILVSHFRFFIKIRDQVSNA
jgi:hypothetical protein